MKGSRSCACASHLAISSLSLLACCSAYCCPRSRIGCSATNQTPDNISSAVLKAEKPTADIEWPLLLRCTAPTCYTPMILGWSQRDEAARVHYAPRRRYGRTAARCLGAAAGDAGDRLSQRSIVGHDRGPSARLPPGPQRHRLCRGRER